MFVTELPAKQSLVTIITKVIDSLLDKYIRNNMNINNVDLEFRSQANFQVLPKQLVCFLDLFKAFDLVLDKPLWEKLGNESLFQYHTVY